MVEESFVRACSEIGRPDGTARCDEELCMIVNDLDQCAVCGDGEVDGEEECDGTNFAGEQCPLGDDRLRCTSECTLDDSLCNKCGNGVVDADEECDVRAWTSWRGRGRAPAPTSAVRRDHAAHQSGGHPVHRRHQRRVHRRLHVLPPGLARSATTTSSIRRAPSTWMAT